jgi:hypothetical protein
MPRYYFHLFEVSTKNLVRDSAGTLLPDRTEARKQALGLARDIVAHGFCGSTWQILVADENADSVATVSLSEVRPCRTRAWLDLVHRAMTYEPPLQPRLFTWLLTAVVLTVIVQAAALQKLSIAKMQATGSIDPSIPKGRHIEQDGAIDPSQSATVKRPGVR